LVRHRRTADVGPHFARRHCRTGDRTTTLVSDIADQRADLTLSGSVARHRQDPKHSKYRDGEHTTSGIRDESASMGHGILLRATRSEEHTSELQSQSNLVCRLLLEKKKKTKTTKKTQQNTKSNQ